MEADASVRLAKYGKKKKWKIRGVTGPINPRRLLVENGSRGKGIRCIQKVRNLFHLLSFVPKGSEAFGTESREVCKLAQVASLDYPVRQ